MTGSARENGGQSRLARGLARLVQSPVFPDFPRPSCMHSLHGSNILSGLALVLLSVFAVPAGADPLEGVVRSPDGAPIPFTYVGLMTPGFAPVESAMTTLNGSFRLAQAGNEGFLVVQPPAKSDPTKHHVYAYQPRIFALTGEEQDLALELPAAVSLVLEAYDADGHLMRWEDFQKLGVHGGQFMYGTNLEDEAIPATCWPVHGALTGADGGPREAGLPALLVEPGQPVAITVLFWPTRGYGKLLLRADNAGQGYTGAASGASRLLRLNLELARSAVAALQARAARYAETAGPEIARLEQELRDAASIEDAAACAGAADEVLTKALRLRDRLELESARDAIPRVRQGTVEVHLEGADGIDLRRCTVALKQLDHDFLFGVFEGSPYNAQAFEAAREAGFEYATVLLGWNWTDSPKLNKGRIDTLFGISRLKALGYCIKAHGVVWMQDYGILPERAKTMKLEALFDAALEHQQALLDVFGERIDIWEAMNEPANTNVVHMPRDDMLRLLGAAAGNIAALGKPALVNSPHEFSFGAKFLIHATDNEPKDDYPLTFSDFLRRADDAGALEHIPYLGLQFYPGFHLNADFGGQQGPACTPVYILDTLDRYAGFEKTLHITEFSLPSTYGDDWFSGYWREPWTEETQADYAEAVYTLAFAHPAVQSIGWWDIMDTKPSVVSGGLLHPDGSPKPVFERLRALIEAWSTAESKTPDSAGNAVFEAFGGRHVLTVTLPDGKSLEREIHVVERLASAITVDLGSAE